MSAATDAIGAHRFIASLFGSAAYRRERHAAPLHWPVLLYVNLCGSAAPRLAALISPIARIPQNQPTKGVPFIRLIDFSKIEEVRVPNFKGGEKELLKKAYADGRNCIMLDRLMPGASIGRHTHETNSEIMYIVSGAATFTVGDTVETVQAGQCHYCPKGGTHMLQNRGEEPLVFFAVVTEQ